MEHVLIVIHLFQAGDMTTNKIYSCSAFISLTYFIVDYVILFPSNVLLFSFFIIV